MAEVPERSAPVEVRTIRPEEASGVVRVVTQAMLAPDTDEHVEHWATWGPTDRTHGAFDGEQPVGSAKWFPTSMSTPGGSVRAAAVTGVGVLPTHRRRGVLSGLMRAQLDQVRDQEHPVAILVAAEWPIYGRYGYGPAIEACGVELAAGQATFTDPPEGTVELVDPAAGARADLEAVHDDQRAERAGVITRDAITWDTITGVRPTPGKPADGRVRAARWIDDDGRVRGVVRYSVAQGWERNRPNGRVDVHQLYAADPGAERELWRHLCSLDWVTTVTAGGRPVDDPVQLWLGDGRHAAQVDRFDHIWARLLDVPAALAARHAGAAASVVVEVDDPAGYAGGRWRLVGEAGAPIEATPTSASADLALPVAVLGARYLGGYRSVGDWRDAGRVDEHAPGAAARLDALLAAPRAPWCPTDF